MTVTPLGDLLRHHASRKPPEAVALIYPNGRVTWQELDERANRRARLFRSLGVSKDDRVAIALRNGPLFHEAAFAAWKLGATPAILSPQLPAQEFAAVIALMEPRLIVADSSVEGEGLPPIISGDADASDFEATPLPSVTATYWKAMCSGGSTGRPKIIVDHMAGALDDAATGLHAVTQMPRDGVILNPGPLYHNGPFLATSFALFLGSTVVGMERFDAKETLRLIEAHQVSWVSLVPAMMHRIWSLPPEIGERYDLSSLKTVWHMAAPCPPWLKEAWIDWLGGERIYELYAGTEGFGATMIRGDEWLQRRGSVGRSIGGRIKAVREDGGECAPGEIGELFFAAPGGKLPSHYLGAEVKSAEGGWLSIGDLGYLDEDGFVYLSDRRTDLIIRGGANIYPAEIEAALDAHPAVASSIVVGLPCEEMGARVHAIIEPKAGCEIDVYKIGDFLAGRLAKYKLPESYEIFRQPLRDEAGKARRTALRDQRIGWIDQGHPFKMSDVG